MLRPDPLLLGVEIDEIAGPHIDRADAEPLAAIVQKIEIDELFERVSLKRQSRSNWLRPARRGMQPGTGRARLKESRLAKEQRHQGTCLIAEITENSPSGV